MTNAEMFVYTYGILMKHGTAHAWNEISNIKDRVCVNWFNAKYAVEALPGMKIDELIELQSKGIYDN